ncbi:hypothetical protein C0Q70_14187 [Pomacea canaliculata]|uniref:EGF-like domain-containing protein n=1 Tax=Pomacea canaliculata TaxID=400727 RepID=A0A2T7NZC4_POMCA|nr:hypothetical protein C0Q70_14187 [Pomacea canaliculata]
MMNVLGRPDNDVGATVRMPQHGHSLGFYTCGTCSPACLPGQHCCLSGNSLACFHVQRTQQMSASRRQQDSTVVHSLTHDAVGKRVTSSQLSPRVSEQKVETTRIECPQQRRLTLTSVLSEARAPPPGGRGGPPPTGADGLALPPPTGPEPTGDVPPPRALPPPTGPEPTGDVPPPRALPPPTGPEPTGDVPPPRGGRQPREAPRGFRGGPPPTGADGLGKLFHHRLVLSQQAMSHHQEMEDKAGRVLGGGPPPTGADGLGGRQPREAPRGGRGGPPPTGADGLETDGLFHHQLVLSQQAMSHHHETEDKAGGVPSSSTTDWSLANWRCPTTTSLKTSLRNFDPSRNNTSGNETSNNDFRFVETAQVAQATEMALQEISLTATLPGVNPQVLAATTTPGYMQVTALKEMARKETETSVLKDEKVTSLKETARKETFRVFRKRHFRKYHKRFLIREALPYCQNGATPVVVAEELFCICPQGFVGLRCDIRIPAQRRASRTGREARLSIPDMRKKCFTICAAS